MSTANLHEPSVCRFSTWNALSSKPTSGASGDSLYRALCSPHSDQLVTVNQQLPQVPLLARGRPDPRKAFLASLYSYEAWPSDILSSILMSTMRSSRATRQRCRTILGYFRSSPTGLGAGGTGRR